MARAKANTSTDNVQTPDYCEVERVPVEVSAFDHCVYLDYPDFDSTDRQIQQYLDSDREIDVRSENLAYPRDAHTRTQAAEYAKDKDVITAKGLPKWGDEVKTTQYLLKGSVLDDHPELFQTDELRERFNERDELDKDVREALWLDVGMHFARRGVVPSNRSGQLMPLGGWGRPTGSYVATVTKDEAGSCPECGMSKSDTQTCVSSSRRTTVPNKYKCDPAKGGCGRQYKGITTG